MLETCTFVNKTTLPVVVESWVNDCGLTTMKGITVLPEQEVQVPSITGEWYLHNLLELNAHFNQWKKLGYSSMGRIGKFRTQKAADNNNSWMEHDDFDIKLIDGIFHWVFSKPN